MTNFFFQKAHSNKDTTPAVYLVKGEEGKVYLIQKDYLI